MSDKQLGPKDQQGGSGDSPTRIRSRLSWYVAGAVIFCALLFNYPYLAWAIAPGGLVPQQFKWVLYVILAIQLIVLLVGVQIARRGLRRPRAATVVAVGCTVLGGVFLWGNLLAFRILDPERDVRIAAQEIVRTEATITSLNPQLGKLGRAAMNLSLPDDSARSVFADEVDVTDIRAGAGTEASLESIALTKRDWELDGQRRVSRDALSIWTPFFEGLDFIEHGKLKTKKAFLSEADTRFDAYVHFRSLARDKQGGLVGVKASIDVTWQRAPESDQNASESWSITGWHTRTFETERVPESLFSEVTDAFVPDEATRAALRRSEHQEHVSAVLRGEEGPDPHFRPSADDRHPGVSIVDINDDGFDDIYVYPLFGTNTLLLNDSGSSFKNAASDIGLDIEGYTSSVLFADFDNDGDKDAFVGRTIAPTLYLENVDGKFVDRTDALETKLPSQVSSITAADFDGDGRLDVYFATYAAFMTRTALFREVSNGARLGNYLLHSLTGDRLTLSGGLLKDFLTAEDAETLHDLAWKHIDTMVTDWVGPPNVLLRNTGDHQFTPSDALPRIFRNTYQATWADFDNDGDSDIYLANDFAKNTFFRNDEGSFVDVTDATGTSDIGFGMGVTWGDVDFDGRQDLYVSNMYSTAGSRITSLLGERLHGRLEEKFGRMAKGNTLFMNHGDTFEHVSGQTKGTVEVEVAGWSWGGQFVDVDNDADLDIYVTSGFYTAPKEHELPEDL